MKFLEKMNRLVKYIICTVYLILELDKKKNITVFSFQGNLFAIIISKLFCVKVAARANSAPSGWIKNSFKKKIFKFIYSLSNIIIVNSLEFQKDFKTLLNIKSECIYNPLDKNRILKLSKKKIRTFNSNRHSLKILNVGRLVDQKNHILLLQALSKLKDKITFELIILGNGNLKSKLINFAKKNNIFNNIKILDYTTNPYPYMKDCDVMIHTAKYEGLPNVLIETQLLKKFIISSDCPTGPKEILNNGKSGLLFKNNNTKDLINKIIYYKKNINFLKIKQTYGYNQLRRFDLNLNLNKYYKKILQI